MHVYMYVYVIVYVLNTILFSTNAITERQVYSTQAKAHTYIHICMLIDFFPIIYVYIHIYCHLFTI